MFPEFVKFNDICIEIPYNVSAFSIGFLISEPLLFQKFKLDT